MSNDNVIGKVQYVSYGVHWECPDCGYLNITDTMTPTGTEKMYCENCSAISTVTFDKDNVTENKV